MVQNAIDNFVARVEILEGNYKRLEEFALPVLRDVHQGIQDSIVDLKQRVWALEATRKPKSKKRRKAKPKPEPKPSRTARPSKAFVQRQGARGAPGVKRARR